MRKATLEFLEDIGLVERGGDSGIYSIRGLKTGANSKVAPNSLFTPPKPMTISAVHGTTGIKTVHPDRPSATAAVTDVKTGKPVKGSHVTLIRTGKTIDYYK